MKLKTKLALLSAASLIAVGTLAGAATRALFTTAASNSNNAVTAGTLIVSSLRDDVPNVGPMFYSDTTGVPGTLSTGVWAPGDSNTRGLFLANSGSLDAKLTTIIAKSADAGGNEVTDGPAYLSDAAFANHANLLIWQLNWYNTDNTPLAWGNIGGTEMNMIMQLVSDGYNAWAADHPNADPSTVPNDGDLMMEAVNQQLLAKINQIRGAMADSTGVYENAQLRVTRMYEAPLASVLNQNLDVHSFGVSTIPTEAQLLAFTIALDRDAGNDMQNVTSYFNFNTFWEQLKNN